MTRRSVGRSLAALAVIGALASACSSGTSPGSTSDRVGTHAFGLLVEHLVDHSRSTPANGPDPAHGGRTLLTPVLFPAHGAATGRPVTGATADRTDGPYPLIVFAHGFGGNVAGYLPLLEKWA